MDEILNYLKDNYINLIVIFLTIASLVVSMFRKKAKVTISAEDVKDVYFSLPDYINLAESTGLSGAEKLNYVIDQALCHLCEKYGLESPSLISSSTITFIKWLVEKILSTPTKKG